MPFDPYFTSAQHALSEKEVLDQLKTEEEVRALSAHSTEQANRTEPPVEHRKPKSEAMSDGGMDKGSLGMSALTLAK
jgi:hypothetical protein